MLVLATPLVIVNHAMPALCAPVSCVHEACAYLPDPPLQESLALPTTAAPASVPAGSSRAPKDMAEPVPDRAAMAQVCCMPWLRCAVNCMDSEAVLGFKLGYLTAAGAGG